MTGSGGMRIEITGVPVEINQRFTALIIIKGRIDIRN
jgi:hypothetical protein